MIVALILSFVGASASAKAAPAGFFGIAPSAVPAATEYATMAQAGVASMRFQISWPAIQQTRDGPIDWSTIDDQVAGAASAGITPLPFFYGTPGWAANCGSLSADLCVRVLPTKSAAGSAGWGALLSAAVARYGRNGSFWRDTSDAYSPPYLPVRSWQIGNEANTAVFAPPRPSVGAYYRLLKISRAALSGGDRRANLILGGLFGLPARPGIPLSGFLDKLYKRKGAKRLFDAIAVHPYATAVGKLVKQVEEARQAAIRNGDRKKPLVITELGWGSASSAVAPPGEGALLRGPEGQAELLGKAFKRLLKKRRGLRLRSVHWFTWRDLPPGAGGRCYLCESAGLLAFDGTFKPAFSAYARIAG